KEKQPHRFSFARRFSEVKQQQQESEVDDDAFQPVQLICRQPIEMHVTQFERDANAYRVRDYRGHKRDHSSQRNGPSANTLKSLAPDRLAIHTNHRFRRRIMTVASRSEPTINHTSSGSLPASVPLPTARSLTRNGSGNGCFTLSAEPVGLVTTSRTAMNDV